MKHNYENTAQEFILKIKSWLKKTSLRSKLKQIFFTKKEKTNKRFNE